MDSQFASILTNFSLNFLRKFTRDHENIVFSPVSISLALVNYTLDSNEPLPADIFRGTDFDIAEFLEKLNVLKSKWEGKNLNTTIWRYPLPENHLKPFQVDENNNKLFKYISMDPEENWRISCDQEENSWTENDKFKVLSIPLAEDSLFFRVFLPKESFEESILNLNADTFQKLIDDLAFSYIHFELPLFKINTDLSISDVSGLTKVNQVFELSDQVTDNIGECHIRTKRSDGMLNKPCETIPYDFPVDRPFLFVVMDRNVPLVMGVFRGV